MYRLLAGMKKGAIVYHMLYHKINNKTDAAG